MLSKTRCLWVLAVSAAFVSAGCSGIKKSLQGSVAVPPTAGTVGIRNMDQLALSMSTVTGVALNTAPVSSSGGNLGTTFTAYNTQIRPWLSADGDAASVTAPMLLSTTSLAGMFCSTLIRQESQSLNKLRGTGLRFDRGVSDLTPAVVGAVNAKFANLFWRRDPSEEETQVLRESVSDTLAAGTTDVHVALLVPCSVALSSLAFLSI